MIEGTPWSDKKTIDGLSREPVGRALATRVAVKLRADDGKRGLWVSHRDYCGHGLGYLQSRFRLVEYSDGDVFNGKEVLAWNDADHFIDWLERQSDYSLSGADESEPELFTESPSKRNNRRITVTRLLDYAYGVETVLAGFREYLIALGDEFDFLTTECGFHKGRPRMDGRECVVRYRRASVGAITVIAEFAQAPFITIAPAANQAGNTHDDMPLNKLAQAIGLDWVPPSLERRDDGKPDYRAFFRSCAGLLRAHLSDRLPVPEGKSAAGVSSPRSEPGAQTAMAAPTADSVKVHLSGAALAVIGFVLLVAEIRYFYGNDLPDATGSPRGNLGLLALLGLPCVVFATGLVQMYLGSGVRQLPAAFSKLALGQRIGLSVATFIITAAATMLAGRFA